MEELEFNDNMDTILADRVSMILYGMKVVERAVSRFPSTETAIGVLTIEDLLQEGYIGLVVAVDKMDRQRVIDSSNPSWTFESFIYQRVFGAIRRAIYQKRGAMRMSERKIREIRKGDADKFTVEKFFNCIFDSIESKKVDGRKLSVMVEDKTEEYDVNFVYSYIMGLVSSNLSKDEAEVVVMTYGLDGKKYSDRDIIKKVNVPRTDLENIRFAAMDKLSGKIDKSLVVNFMNS